MADYMDKWLQQQRCCHLQNGAILMSAALPEEFLVLRPMRLHTADVRARGGGTVPIFCLLL